MIIEDLSKVGTNKGMHELIEEARSATRSATTKAKYKEYAMGYHRAVVDADRKRLLGTMSIGDVQENLIGRCLSQIVSRVVFDEYLVNDNDVKDFLDREVVAKNQLPRAMAAIITRVQTDGSAAASISWRKRGVDDPGRPVLHHEEWWDGDKGIFVAVSDTGEVFWACSEWYGDNEQKYRTVYLPGRIMRFALEGEGWQMVLDTRWERPDGRPLGVPVIHFSNGPSAFGPYAESTVAKVVDAQDALNASLFNRQAVSSLTGAQIYYGTGVQQPEAIAVGAGKFWSSTDPQSRFGAIPPGDMSSLIQEADDLRAIISGEFPVPMYRLGQGDWPSGTALIRADTPMIKRARELITVNSPSTVQIAHRATEMANAFGGYELDEDAVITAQFEEIDELDPGTEVEIAQAKVDLYTALVDLPEPLLRKLDLLTEDEITKLREWREAQQEELVADATPREPVASQNGAG